MKYDLSPGEALLIKRALQLQCKVWLEQRTRTECPIAREQIDSTIRATDNLAERFRKGITRAIAAEEKLAQSSARVTPAIIAVKLWLEGRSAMPIREVLECALKELIAPQSQKG